jgi:NADH-quinone oxidoreductase subunit I
MSTRQNRVFPGVGILRSAAVSMRHVFQRKLTVQYPDEAPAMGYRFRGRHIFHQDVCIGCTQCERVCPVIAIKMEEHKDPGTRKVVVDRFAVDLGICYYCGLCEEVCPTDPKAVHLGPDFELATHDRRLLIYEMDQLVGPKPLPSKPKAVAAANGDGEKPAAAPRPERPAAAAGAGAASAEKAEVPAAEKPEEAAPASPEKPEATAAEKLAAEAPAAPEKPEVPDEPALPAPAEPAGPESAPGPLKDTEPESPAEDKPEP